ncbi:hypothetical protein EOM33_02325 [Candidatus Saccharibacteria bacterium]|nr:hypothetical protein [Candidatus Saccharibacteria bacterium]
MKLQDLTCGNNPKALFHSLRVGSSVYLIPCKHCGKVLVSIKTSVDETSMAMTAYFKCECGGKFKKPVITIDDGHLVMSARVHVVPERMRKGIQGWSNPSRCYISFEDETHGNVYYIVTDETIRLKKGIPVDA